MQLKKALTFFGIFALAAVLLAACGGAQESNNTGGNEETSQGNGGSEEEANASGEELSGNVVTAGSSTVYPMQLAMAEWYSVDHPEVNVTVDSIGSGGGFEKSTKGELDFSNASRPIKEEEQAIADENGVQLEPLVLAYDGLTIAVNADNSFVDSLTVEQLQEIFLQESGNTKWSEINPDWPEETINIFAPGHDSGTFDYFNETILEEKPMREDENTTLSEDDNNLVRGIKNDEYAIGFFGYAYYLQNEDSLKALAVDNGDGPVEPNLDTIQSGEYSPLSRPLFTYINVDSLQKPQVHDYAQFVLDNAGKAAEEVGYVPLPDEKYAEQKEQVNSWAE